MEDAEESLWEGACYHFDVEVPVTYPEDIPIVKTSEPIYHPNVDNQGNVILNIIKDQNPNKKTKYVQ